MIINRTVSEKLSEWKNRAKRKPLILRGARQVGKTTIVIDFAKDFKHSILLNLEKEKDRFFFKEGNDIKVIVESLFLSHGIDTKQANNTILFIDEIQEAPFAIQTLRYFYEEYPELHVIAAGSLLEFSIKDVKSFPVGRVEFLYLSPLSFIEFLDVVNHSALKQLQTIPTPTFAHQVLMNLFNTYTIIGGMPEIVSNYIKSNNVSSLQRIYESIWSTYKNDIQKYAHSDTARKVIKHVIETAPLYLDQRVKFQNFGNSNYRSREVGEAMRNLNDAKVIQLIYPSTDVEIPIKPDLKKSPRMQFLDTGIVNYILGIQADMMTLKDLSKAFRGAIIPHIITQELISLNISTDIKPNFWVREKTQSSSEVDLIYTYRNIVIPIEIKSGKTGSLKSLHQFIDQSTHHYAIRIYGGEFKVEKTITPNKTPYVLLNLPYYCMTQIEGYLEYFMDNY